MRITNSKAIENTLSRGNYYFSIAANGLITKDSTYVATPTPLNTGDMINIFDGNYDDNSFTLDPGSQGGFNPTFVGTAYSNLYVSGNGGFAFGGPNNNGNGSVASIPTLYMVNNDGNLQKVYYKVTGTTPDRILAYKIQGNTKYDISGINYDYDIYFYEALTGLIDVVVNQEPTKWNAFQDNAGYVTWGVTDGSNWVDGLANHTNSIGAKPSGIRITGTGLRLTLNIPAGTITYSQMAPIVPGSALQDTTATVNGTTGFTINDPTSGPTTGTGVAVTNLTPGNVNFFNNLGPSPFLVTFSLGAGSSYTNVLAQVTAIPSDGGLVFFFDDTLTYPATFNFPFTYMPPPSDRRMKRNITFLETRNGIKIYSFQYLWSEEYFVGVMAQDLLGTEYESAVGEHNGHYTVDYSKLGFNMQLLSQYKLVTV